MKTIWYCNGSINREEAKAIEAAFKSKNAINKYNYSFTDKHNIYIAEEGGIIDIYSKGTIIEAMVKQLGKKLDINQNSIKKFKTYEKVIVKSSMFDDWVADLYSHYDKKRKFHFTISGRFVGNKEILPYDTNSDKLGKPAYD